MVDEEVRARAWLDGHRTWERATEITVPVRQRVGPTWSYGKGGGWFAALVTRPNPSGDFLAECDHLHTTPAEAWKCAADLARALVIEALAADAKAPSGG